MLLRLPLGSGPSENAVLATSRSGGELFLVYRLEPSACPCTDRTQLLAIEILRRTWLRGFEVGSRSHPDRWPWKTGELRSIWWSMAANDSIVAWKATRLQHSVYPWGLFMIVSATSGTWEMIARQCCNRTGNNKIYMHRNIRMQCHLCTR